MALILVINPGSTSTKIAVYADERRLCQESVEHSVAELSAYENIFDQFDLRLAVLRNFLERNGYAPGGVLSGEFAAVVARGGLLPEVESGAYRVGPHMLDTLRHRATNEHASNLGAALAQAIAEKSGIPAFIYDPVTVDELEPIARVTGLKEMTRRGQGHNLNMRAAAIKKARELGIPYSALTAVVAHLGGGITLSLHHGGRMIDMISDDEGPFSPERAGGLPGFQLIELAASGACDVKGMLRKVIRDGGLVSHFGTSDAREVFAMMERGDRRAALVLEAMAHNVAKNVGKLAVVMRGGLRQIILTGGLANSGVLTGWIRERVEFLAPVTVYPGENEMESLALGALRVLRGEERAKEYGLNSRR